MTRTLLLGVVVGVCAGVASADLQYGDGTVKPRSDRWVYAMAGTVGGGPRSEEVQTFGNQEFEAYATAWSSDDGGGITFPQAAYSRSYQHSTLGSLTLSFTMWTYSRRMGNYTWAADGTSLDIWMHVDQGTPYYLFSTSYGNAAAITADDGTPVPIEYSPQGDFNVASGALGAGWYHVQISAGSRYSESDGITYGFVGVPTPGIGAAAGLAGVGLLIRRRRR